MTPLLTITIQEFIKVNYPYNFFKSDKLLQTLRCFITFWL